MLTFENYIFNFHMWLHALAATTPQREAALGFSQARKTIISIGRFTKMFNLLLNCDSILWSTFPNLCRMQGTGRMKRLLGKSFGSRCGQAVASWWACKPLQPEEEAAASARRGADGPRAQERQRYHGLPQNQLGVWATTLTIAPARQKCKPHTVQRRAQGDLIEGREWGEMLPTILFSYIHFYQTRFYLAMHLPLLILCV